MLYMFVWQTISVYTDLRSPHSSAPKKLNYFCKRDFSVISVLQANHKS